MLTLEKVYGATTYYLANRGKIDAHLSARRLDFASKRQTSRDADPTFYQKLADAKRSLKKVKAI